MKILSRIKNAVHRATAPSCASGGGGATMLRRWEAGKTDRLNETQWLDAKGQSVNTDLSQLVTTLRARCSLEIARNPIVEGVIMTHVIDTVGDRGPTLQVVCKSAPNYAKALEDLWRPWWALPDYNRQYSGVELLQLWVRGHWPDGEGLMQLVDDEPHDDIPISLALNIMAPRRLATPMGQMGDPSIVMGIKFAPGKNGRRSGRPQTYYINDEADSQYGAALSLNPDPIPAAQVIHDFVPLEPGQARGAPWLAPCLPVMADLRSYDQAVLDAARLAAANSMALTTKNDAAEFIEVAGTMEIERNSFNAIPPGYELKEIESNQPTAQYIDYRQERLRELGRVIGMPLMMVLLDSRKHNYSSARFDSQVYQRGIRLFQQRITRRMLNRLVDLVAREGQLRAGLGDNGLRFLRERPQGVLYIWTWPAFPHVDPKKEAEGSEIRLRNRITTISDELADRGRDLDEHIATLKREQEDFKRAGIDYPAASSGKPVPDAPIPEPPEEDGESRDEEQNNRMGALAILNGSRT